jgi:predicted metal-dependent phosphoesterase TrpH
MYADLHMHTTHSDGTNTPREILELAKSAGISEIAITDHDTITGSIEAKTYINDYNIRLIPGIELTTMLNGAFAHVLGYYIDFENPKLLAYFKQSTGNMTENARINFENAKKEGLYDYSWQRVLELNPGRSFVGGIHAVQAMVHDGHSPKIEFKELFADYYSSVGKYHIHTEVKTPFEAIDVIREAGGVSSLAHPKLVGNDEVVLEIIEYGVNGLEAFHPTNDKNDVQRYIDMANHHGIYVTGGTDWHGKNSAPYITHFGMCGLESKDYPILIL